MRSFATLLLTLVLSLNAAAENPTSWTEPIEPFRIIGNVYYVGTAELTSYLIATPGGHILLDAPMEQNVPHLLRSIESLGFDPEDIEIMINSHAHFDHAGGFSDIRRITGARLLVSAPDAELLDRGGRDDFAFGDSAAFTPVKADEIIGDNQVVELGGSRLTAIATPGHTMGGTSWVMDVEEEGQSYTVLFANSMSAPGYDLVTNERYPEIIDDYRGSFDRLGQIDADVFLSTHGSFLNLRQKAAAIREGTGSNPFIDPTESRRFVERWRGEIENQYAEQSTGGS